MIHDAQDENDSERLLIGYFERALGDLGLAAWLALLRPGEEARFRERIIPQTDSVLALDTWKRKKEQILLDPEGYLNWEPLTEPEQEIWAHYRLQSAIVATMIGHGSELRTLAAQLITEPVNRKIVISYFLGHLTSGKVGLRYKDIPTKHQILAWVNNISDIQIFDRLPRISASTIE